MDYITSMGFLINALDGGGDIGKAFPQSDAEDLSRGAHFIPGEVTLARRVGQKVEFITNCSMCCWYWLMPNGDRVYHFDGITYTDIARSNGKEPFDLDDFSPRYPDGAGPCPQCGNPYTNGGIHKKEEICAGLEKS